MSSSAVVSRQQALNDVAAELQVLRQRVESLKGGAPDPTSDAIYSHLSRDLFDLTTKVETWADDAPQVTKPFGELRVLELKTADSLTLMKFYAEQVVAYLARHGGAVAFRQAAQAVAKQLHVSQDEIYYGITYGEQAELFAFNGYLLTLTKEKVEA